MEQSKNKRARRTRAELEADVFDAIRQLASEKGLAQITFTDIMQRADIQMSVLLNNYKNIERLLDKYATFLIIGCTIFSMKNTLQTKPTRTS